MRPEHSTFEIIRVFARVMRHAVVATPPRQECELSCWIPVSRYGFDTCAVTWPSVPTLAWRGDALGQCALSDCGSSLERHGRAERLLA